MKEKGERAGPGLAERGQGKRKRGLVHLREEERKKARSAEVWARPSAGNKNIEIASLGACNWAELVSVLVCLFPCLI